MHAAKFTSNRAWHGTKSEALYATMHNGQLRASSDRKAWKALVKWCAPSLCSSSKVYVKIRITMWNQLVHRFPQIETSPPDNP